MTDLLLQRGAQPIDLDKPRVLFFDLAATFTLVQKYGLNYLRAIYRLEGTALVLADPDALVDVIHLGVQAECRQRGEEMTLDEVRAAIGPWNIREIAGALVKSLMGAAAMPQRPGKSAALPLSASASAAEETAEADSAAPAKRKTPPEPGATRASTSMKRSASPSRRSTGR